MSVPRKMEDADEVPVTVKEEPVPVEMGRGWGRDHAVHRAELESDYYANRPLRSFADFLRLVATMDASEADMIPEHEAVLDYWRFRMPAGKLGSARYVSLGIIEAPLYDRERVQERVSWLVNALNEVARQCVRLQVLKLTLWQPHELRHQGPTHMTLPSYGLFGAPGYTTRDLARVREAVARVFQASDSPNKTLRLRTNDNDVARELRDHDADDGRRVPRWQVYLEPIVVAHDQIDHTLTPAWNEGELDALFEVRRDLP